MRRIPSPDWTVRPQAVVFVRRMINVFAISMIHGLRGLSSREGLEAPAAKLWLTMDRMMDSASEHSARSRRCAGPVDKLPVEFRLMTGA